MAAGGCLEETEERKREKWKNINSKAQSNEEMAGARKAASIAAPAQSMAET